MTEKLNQESLRQDPNHNPLILSAQDWIILFVHFEEVDVFSAVRHVQREGFRIFTGWDDPGQAFKAIARALDKLGYKPKAVPKLPDGQWSLVGHMRGGAQFVRMLEARNPDWG